MCELSTDTVFHCPAAVGFFLKTAGPASACGKMGTPRRGGLVFRFGIWRWDADATA